MQFNSYTFVVYFAVVMALHYAPLPWRLKKFNLLWASYLFYAAWNPPFVILLWITTIVDYWCARSIFRAPTPATKKLALIFTLTINLGMLGFFKYGPFLLENFVALGKAVGFDYQPAPWNIVLPMGISFYTFISLSYTIDIYRGDYKPCESFLDYALYVTFFPHLVCGPIIRASDLLPQLVEPKQAPGREIAWGLHLIVLGLFQKVVLADGLLAPVVEKVYDAATLPSTVDSWMATLAFAGQIFCDFAGYSTCAVGAAMALGFWLPNNFRCPYAAIGFSDFWRRWHISLSSWLRDYLYIALGGNRRGNVQTYANLMMTMLLGGLWHGASWTFVAWGALHGGLLCVERFLRRIFQGDDRRQTPPVRLALTAATFGAVCFTWVFFRAHSFDKAWAVTSAMTGLGSAAPVMLLVRTDWAVVVVVMGGLLAAHWAHAQRPSFAQWVATYPWPVRSSVLAAMLVAIAVMPSDDRAFIYFQF